MNLTWSVGMKFIFLLLVLMITNCFAATYSFHNKEGAEASIVLPDSIEFCDIYNNVYNYLELNYMGAKEQVKFCPVKDSSIFYVAISSQFHIGIKMGNKFHEEQRNRPRWQELGLPIVEYENPDQDGHCTSKNGDISLTDKKSSSTSYYCLTLKTFLQ